MKQILKKYLCLFLCVLLCLTAVACSAEKEKNEDPETNWLTFPAETGEEPLFSKLWDEAIYREDKEFGDGENRVTVIVEAEGNSVIFTLYTDKETLADALLEHKLVEGEEGPYGLYVKKVNGMTADYDVDQSYWAFSKGGETMMTGVSDTKIINGDRFEIVYTK